MNIKAIFWLILQAVFIAVMVNLVFMLAPDFFYHSVLRAVFMSAILITAIHYLIYWIEKVRNKR